MYYSFETMLREHVLNCQAIDQVHTDMGIRRMAEKPVQTGLL